MKYELKKPIEFVGKKTGNVIREVTEIDLEEPTGRLIATMERRGLLQEGHETELVLELVKACGRLEDTVVDRLAMSDINGAMEAMQAAGFFDFMEATKTPPPKPGKTEETEE